MRVEFSVTRAHAASCLYLSPEPMLQAPDFVEAQARQGVMLPSYAYAGDNPIENVDRDGLFFSSVTTPHGVAAMAAAGMLTGASVVVSVNSSQHSSPSSSSCGGPAFQPEPLSMWLPPLVVLAVAATTATPTKRKDCEAIWVKVFEDCVRSNFGQNVSECITKANQDQSYLNCMSALGN